MERNQSQRTICLGVRKTHDHTAVTIHDTVSKILAEYEQQIQNVGVIATDNAAANKRAFRQVFLALFV